jgi:ABC-type nitrate/sulfonate/bicarbonate transport system ATPase subunit
VIQLENVNLRFGTKVIFDNYNYSFEDNKVYCIMGKSGCGKTTLLRIIAGLLKPNSGSATYNGAKIHKSMPDIFMMHQSYTNFPWKTCFQNVLFPIALHQKVTEEHQKECFKMLDLVGLNGYANKYPYELSGGMKQRLSLARVLMSNPKVILMDEPLSALDSVTRIKMQDLLLAFHQETQNLMIMVTHDLTEAEKMNDVMIKL